MDFKNTNEIIEAAKERPKSTLVRVIIFLILIILMAYFKGFFEEKGKEHAGPSRETSGEMPSPKEKLGKKSISNNPVTVIDQQTAGNQSPAVNVAPGGSANVIYGAEKNRGAKDKAQ